MAVQRRAGLAARVRAGIGDETDGWLGGGSASGHVRSAVGGVDGDALRGVAAFKCDCVALSGEDFDGWEWMMGIGGWWGCSSGLG
ncbi:hypothetical protein CYMTET_5977 [Cymbomonas tetramitiformis]|uniref:Uncharacterized protein n=1 Tax=Cymbomonas tetramitiformis TaxID=36881 RepID=A0AAE0LIW2_9CHLO|nr:hypothetical protein CYMTET_5977 [Cymbomonas tetramitiformis]